MGESAGRLEGVEHALMGGEVSSPGRDESKVTRGGGTLYEQWGQPLRTWEYLAGIAPREASEEVDSWIRITIRIAGVPCWLHRRASVFQVVETDFRRGIPFVNVSVSETRVGLLTWQRLEGPGS